MDISWSGCAGGLFPRLPLTAPVLSHFWEPLSLPSKPNAELKTLSNWPKLLIWLVWLGLPTECSTAALPQQRLGGCSRLWAQGGGVWLALPREKNHGLRNQRVIHGAFPDELKQQLALNSFAHSIWGPLLENWEGSSKKSVSVTDSAGGKHNSYRTCILFAGPVTSWERLHRNPT